MSQDQLRTGLLSRFAAPFSKAARLLTRRKDDGRGKGRKASAAAEPTDFSPPAPEDFQMTLESLLNEESGRFQIKLQIISLVEFREAVGDKWNRLSEKVLLIAESVIHRHLGAGNVFARQGSDSFVLVFRTCSAPEGRRRAQIIAQDLGARLVGDQFIGAQEPLALAVEVSLSDCQNADGSLNLSVIQNAVGHVRTQAAAARAEAGELRAHLLPSAPMAPTEMGPDGRPLPRPMTEEKVFAPGEDPKWQELVGEGRQNVTSWVLLDKRNKDDGDDQNAPPLPPDSRLFVQWRPTWIGATETIGAYQARLQRQDGKDFPILDSVSAYPHDHAPSIASLDRAAIGAAMRDFTASEKAKNGTAVILPIHWQTLSGDNPMDALAPLSELPEEVRKARLILDVFAMPSDVRTRDLTKAMGLAASLCWRVGVRTSLSSPCATLAADCGAHMVGIDIAEVPAEHKASEEVLLGALRLFNDAALRDRLTAYVWGLRQRKVLAGVVQSGFAMLNGPQLMKDIPKPAKILPAPKSRLTAAPAA